MSISHHIPARLMRAYAAGSLPASFATVVAAHVSVCDECRARLEAEEIAGGAVLENLNPVGGDEARLRAAVLARLDDALEAPEAPAPEGHGIYPGPVMAALKGRAPRWKPLGAGIRQTILASGDEGSLRLLYIPPGAAVPDHGHGGLELTMVLQGSFGDETGHYGVGDVEVADDSLEHTPIAGPEAPCIALAATDAPLRFRALVPRLLQPLFRI
ncbi:MAG: transcriptional regulator [Alphaproteobacteria bacterium]|nr:MAG: transcriptional regulator [Alphaproteobacteria bacterium]